MNDSGVSNGKSQVFDEISFEKVVEKLKSKGFKTLNRCEDMKEKMHRK